MKRYQAENLINYIKEHYDNSDFIKIEAIVTSFKGELEESFQFYSKHYKIGHIEAVSFETLAKLVIATYEAKGVSKCD